MSDFFEKLLCGFVRIITCDSTFGLEDKSPFVGRPKRRLLF